LPPANSGFSYDVRGNSYVNADLVAAYDVPVGKDGLPDLEVVLQHALDNDAVVSGYRDPADGKMWYSSCRIFTDRYNAVTFAQGTRKGNGVQLEPMGGDRGERDR
jgi:hypothetical protein